MNELQVWFQGNDTNNNWIYFKTNATNIDDAINHFAETLKYSGVELCDMQPVQYDLWDEDKNHVASKENNEERDVLQFTIDIEEPYPDETLEERIPEVLEEAGYTVWGCNWSARWTNKGYHNGDDPISTNYD